MRAKRHIATARVALAVLVMVSCAGSRAPWDVAKGDEDRFRETTRTCRLLTDDGAGELVPDKFETCMKRRGWRRQCFIERLFRRD